ncbi:MAG: hypothetical protein KC419_21670 [Anaerolineales bacterium]|nr:hypothetical protein [Anaerolineales bacterium]
MSTRNKKKSRQNVWAVILGLFLAIGLIAGGAYALNDMGLLSSGMPADGGGALPEFVEGEMPDDASLGERPLPPDGASEGSSSQVLISFATAIGQMAAVITLVYYGQKLLGWLEKRLRKPKLTDQTA